MSKKPGLLLPSLQCMWRIKPTMNMFQSAHLGLDSATSGVVPWRCRTLSSGHFAKWRMIVCEGPSCVIIQAKSLFTWLGGSAISFDAARSAEKLLISKLCQLRRSTTLTTGWLRSTCSAISAMMNEWSDSDSLLIIAWQFVLLLLLVFFLVFFFWTLGSKDPEG